MRPSRFLRPTITIATSMLIVSTTGPALATDASAASAPVSPAVAGDGALVQPASLAAPGPDERQGSTEAYSTVGGPITRSEIIARSEDWVTRAMPYSQSDYAPDPTGRLYRTDCSGFVSLALHADRSYSTRTISQISEVIRKEDLRPGDYLNSYDRHVVLFLGWANAEHTRYLAREETSAKGYALERVVPYPYWTNQSTYVPMRYLNVIEGELG